MPVSEQGTTTSNTYRSAHDPASHMVKKFLAHDTPGHGKLRHEALARISALRKNALRGIIFLVDASALASSADDQIARETAEYLHDVLLRVQKGMSGSEAKHARDFYVLVAANKMDLFTALPTKTVQSVLEREIGKVRKSREKGLLDAEADTGHGHRADETDDWLGEVGSTEFAFAQLEDSEIHVEVMGGNVCGEDGSSIQEWWGWVGQRL